MSKVIHGDCVKEMAKLEENSIDAIVCDPPYGLKFMGKDFDDLGEGTQQREWHKRWAQEALRVLKPGGHLIAFGGTRTYHHLATAVEEAGFEIRDQIQWLYGSGFPKSLNVGKAIDKAKGKERKIVGKKTGFGNGGLLTRGTSSFTPGEFDITAPATKAAKQWEGWGTALKPANEPIVLARKPFKGTVAENVQEHGTGALNIDESRIGTEQRTHCWAGRSDTLSNKRTDASAGLYAGKKAGQTAVEGRWPANVLLDEGAGALLDEQSGISRSKKAKRGNQHSGRHGGLADIGPNIAEGTNTERGHDDQGGASRFFYCAKTSKKERNAGIDKEASNNHPTVKPISLMRYLCRLVTPPGGTVLDPFLGSGTTGCAAALEGFDFVGIEMDKEYIKIARARMGHWEKEAKKS